MAQPELKVQLVSVVSQEYKELLDHEERTAETVPL